MENRTNKNPMNLVLVPHQAVLNFSRAYSLSNPALSSTNSRNYQCMSCVIITPELKKKLNFKTVGELQKDIEACENIIKAQREIHITKVFSENV